MIGKRPSRWASLRAGGVVCAVLALGLGPGGRSHGQPAANPVRTAEPARTNGSAVGFDAWPSLETKYTAGLLTPVPGERRAADEILPIPYLNDIQQTGCSSCGSGGGLLGLPRNDGPGAGSGGCSSCGGNPCIPGRKPCYPCEGQTVLGRFLCGLYECICCPDPCYDPRWLAIADSAFFVESVRPQTHQRIRWDHARNLVLPDRAEYFWPRADGLGLGPSPLPFARAETSVNYDEASLYTEVAASHIGIFFEMPYREMEGQVTGHASGFTDINLGTKTLIFDCELLQVSMIMRTCIPTGNFRKGLGTAHMSLEPSLVLGIRIGPETFLQGQIAEWIPLGGEPGYAGSVLHSHWSLNHVLCRPIHDVPLIGTLELNSWTFQDGGFTSPVLGSSQKASGVTYLSLGPGLRMVVCDRIDFGIGTAFALNDPHWASQLYRTEFRWRY